jgi:hypothetical protein
VFVRTLLWQLGWRSTAEALLWSAQRSQRDDPGTAGPIVFFSILLVGGPAAIFVMLSFARWLVTGRGPGLRFVVYDLGGPTQRVRSRSRSGSRPGRA